MEIKEQFLNKSANQVEFNKLNDPSKILATYELIVNIFRIKGNY